MIVLINFLMNMVSISNLFFSKNNYVFTYIDDPEETDESDNTGTILFLNLNYLIIHVQNFR